MTDIMEVKNTIMGQKLDEINKLSLIELVGSSSATVEAKCKTHLDEPLAQRT